MASPGGAPASGSSAPGATDKSPSHENPSKPSPPLPVSPPSPAHNAPASAATPSAASSSAPDATTTTKVEVVTNISSQTPDGQPPITVAEPGFDQIFLRYAQNLILWGYLLLLLLLAALLVFELWRRSKTKKR